MKLKKGDNVIVIAGKSKGMKGAIVRAYPAKNMVLIDGVNVVKRHRKPTQQARKGQIIDMPMPIHASNVQILDPKGGNPTRIKISRDKDGKRSRVAVGSGEAIK
jgi:large subunit ribosomal protein L24